MRTHTQLIYLIAKTSLSCTARVLEAGQDNLGHYLILDQTVAHVRGGGQLGDRGSISGIPLIDVRRVEGEVRHYVDGPAQPVGAVVTVDVDRAFRAEQSCSHTAGHLVAAALEQEIPGVSANAAQHWPTDAWAAGAWNGPLADDLAERLQRFVDAAIQADWAVKVAAGDLRTVAIHDHRQIPCGGTHVASLGAIGLLRIADVRIKKGVLKARYVCGEKEGT